MITLQDKENFDSYEAKLEEKTKELKSCQEDKGYTSCMNCDSFISCTTRRSYVLATYESMNKSQTGGFSF
ncbi:hypothetical protein PT520_09445 [Aliarcobacter butzleri]|uniref:Uncharacterized protein n=1 Tax=Aliarcobacter butzleri TaxID=28197 RepID=A0AAW6VRI7_9BACT|nr:hypothetical protein [Aliarcobacter butzleri]MDK2062739.1 hypothetical protein [Aliarcobacter butzleri]